MSHFLTGEQRELLKEIGLYDENNCVFNSYKGNSFTTDEGYKIVCVERHDDNADEGEISVLIDAIHPDGDDLSVFGLTFCYTNPLGDEWHLMGLI